MINLEAPVRPAFHHNTKQGLEEYLASRSLAQTGKELCGPGGERYVDMLVIVNATGVHKWTDLKALRVPC